MLINSNEVIKIPQVSEARLENELEKEIVKTEKEVSETEKYKQINLSKRTLLNKLYLIEQKVDLFKEDFPNEYNYFFGEIEKLRNFYKSSLEEEDKPLTLKIDPEINGELIWHKRKDKLTGKQIWAPYTREYAPENPERPYMTIWLDVNTTRQAKAHQKTIFSDVDPLETIKPEELIERILELATDKDDIVLDSFLGSGTTAAVAHKMERRYIGIEMGDHAMTHCVPRLEKVIAGTPPPSVAFE